MISYKQGDATQPQVNGTTAIVHVVNTEGGWGRGFVLALSKRWPAPEAAYRRWHKDGADATAGVFGLGNVQWVAVEETPRLWFVNMIAQKGYAKGTAISLQLDALAQCLHRVAAEASHVGAGVVMPRIGCGLAGGTWSQVEPLIKQAFEPRNVPVTVYSLEGLA